MRRARGRVPRQKVGISDWQSNGPERLVGVFMPSQFVENVERRGYSWSEPPSEYVEVVDSTPAAT